MSGNDERVNEREEPRAPTGEVGKAMQPPGRRAFIGWILGGVGAVVAALLSIPLIRVAFFPLSLRSDQGDWADAGAEDQFTNLTVPLRQTIKVRRVDGWRETVSERIVYISKDGSGKLVVLTAVCPHLGCQVQWQPSLDKFKCPCHGGTFTSDGKYVSGPPPRGMDTLPMKVENGRVMVEYQYFRNLDPRKEVVS